VVPTAVVPFVLAAREAQQRDCDERGVKWDPRGLAFTGPGQTAKDPRADHEDWEDLLRRAGVADSPLHAGRHSAGTLALASGTDTRVIQDMLGHASAQTTKGYVEVANKLKKEAVDRVAAMLFDGALSQLLQPDGATKTARS
jgi:integrase